MPISLQVPRETLFTWTIFHYNNGANQNRQNLTSCREGALEWQVGERESTLVVSTFMILRMERGGNNYQNRKMKNRLATGKRGGHPSGHKWVIEFAKRSGGTAGWEGNRTSTFHSHGLSLEMWEEDWGWQKKWCRGQREWPWRTVERYVTKATIKQMQLEPISKKQILRKHFR